MAMPGLASRDNAMQAVSSVVISAGGRRRMAVESGMVQSFCFWMESGILPRTGVALYARNPAGQAAMYNCGVLHGARRTPMAVPAAGASKNY